MGYITCVGHCYGCNKIFSFNPNRVPSVRDANNVRQPVCRECMTVVNAKRIANGLEPFTMPKDAYEPCNENELEA